MANGENVIEFEIEIVNYTYVSPITLQPDFPTAKLTSPIREQPSPLRRRGLKEMGKLQEHPFFMDVDQQ